MMSLIAGIVLLMTGAYIGYHAGMYLPLGLAGVAVTFVDGTEGTWQTIAMWVARATLFTLLMVAILVQKTVDEKNRTTPKLEICADGLSGSVAIVALSMLLFQAGAPWWASPVIFVLLLGTLIIYLGRHWAAINRANRPVATPAVTIQPAP